MMMSRKVPKGTGAMKITDNMTPANRFSVRRRQAARGARRREPQPQINEC
jgi:hypothetical protein